MPLGEDAELQLRDFLFCWQMTIAAHYYTSRGAYSGYFQDHSCRGFKTERNVGDTKDGIDPRMSLF